MVYKIAIASIFFGFIIVELLAKRFLFKEKTRPKDILLDVVSTIALTSVIVPIIFYLAPMLAEIIVPASADMLAHLPWWLMFVLLLLGDDLTQYWWHRLSHSFGWLYSLHRAHHSAEYLSVRIVYRNNLIYYAFMPGIWVSGILIYWGFAEVYVVYAILKMSTIIAAHSSVAWDQPLYKNPFTAKLMWLVERIISTPATHSAHHGKHAEDGVTNYKGNFGNFLFFWDVLFGTAKITRRRPEQYGLENIEEKNGFQELLWPFG